MSSPDTMVCPTCFRQVVPSTESVVWVAQCCRFRSVATYRRDLSPVWWQDVERRESGQRASLAENVARFLPWAPADAVADLYLAVDSGADMAEIADILAENTWYRVSGQLTK